MVWARVVAVLVLCYVLLFGAVATAVCLGGLAYVGVQSRVVGFVVGVMTYLCCMASREWFLVRVVDWLDPK